MKRIAVIAFYLSAFVVCGCSKALTNSSAVEVAQGFVDAHNGGIVSTSIRQLTSQLGPEQPQPLQQPGIQRLLKEGFIQQKTVTVPYANFSGQFSGDFESGGQYSLGMFHASLQLQTTASIPPHIQGTYTACTVAPMGLGPTNDPCDRHIVGAVSGVVQRNGPSTVLLTNSTERPQNFTLIASLVRAEPDVIFGTLRDNTSNPYTGGEVFNVRFQGRATGQEIQQEVYVYDWTDKAPKDALDRDMLKLGHLIVDSCDQLLLASETAAKAVCKTRVDLTKGSQVIFGNGPTDKSVTVQFGKQPDGTWVTTEINYSAPPYSINQ